MNKEFEFLNIISKNLSDSSYLGDDCAYLRDLGIVVSSDYLIENVHFCLKYMTPFEIARKSLLVNISDILASGAIPKYITINLSGKLNNKFIDEFYKGINTVALEYGINIIGGDLTGGDKISISITIIGLCANRNISSRYSAKEDYVVAVCGEFGSSAQGLDDLIKNKKDSKFIEIHKKPILYPEISTLISTTSKKPYAMMDSSDGLTDCLEQISAKSKVRIDFEFDKIPHSTNNNDFILYGGEDYCLVCCLDEEDFKNINSDKLIKIGKCSCGDGVYLDNKKITFDKGFNHFE